MRGKYTKVYQLVNKIDSGKLSYDDVTRKIHSIEEEFGPLDLLYDVEDRNDSAYYDELRSDAKMGLCNKESLLKMAEIKLGRKPPKREHSQRIIVIGLVIVLLLIGGLIIAVCRR